MLYSCKKSKYLNAIVREDMLNRSKEAVLPCFKMFFSTGIPHPCNFRLRNTIHGAGQHLFAAQ